MTVYRIILFVHVVAAMTLVGASAFAHVMATGTAHARSLEGARAPVRVLGGIIQITKFASMLTLAAGLYLAFDGHWWRQGWVVVALVLFAGAGVVANVLLEPWVKRVTDALEGGEEPASIERLYEVVTEPRIILTAWLMTATDLAIIFLMTAKPGYPLAVLATVLCWIGGVALATRQQRAEQAVVAPAIQS